jgi:hypothetical protein
VSSSVAPTTASAQFGDLVKKVGKAALDKAKETPGPKDSTRAPAARAAAQQLVLPASSKAPPPIVGITLGSSTVADVRTALAKIAPALKMREDVRQLVGETENALRKTTTIEIQGGKYLYALLGTTAAYSPVGANCSVSNPRDGNCESVQVRFSAAPSSGVATMLNRQIIFNQSPTLENTINALKERYGTPAVTRDVGSTREFAWGWTSTGEPVQFTDMHVCFHGSQHGVLQSGDRLADAKRVLEAGCASVLHVSVTHSNDLVRMMSYMETDNYALYTSELKTVQYVNAAIADFQKKERDAASKVAVPQ